MRIYKPQKCMPHKLCLTFVRIFFNKMNIIKNQIPINALYLRSVY